ncbi:hypothetical protein OPQ81_005113 [Rhizoctonia solani]|nr:hypothetical protein OPQ81_005113 [Rhizoctonia solani]
MPTVVSSRALVPIGPRIRNAPEDSDASKAIVLRGQQQGDTEDLSKALIIRPADDGRDDRQALVLYRKKGAQEMLPWHKSSALLPPFRLEELIRIADSQFMACLRDIQNLQDPLCFFDDITETIEHTREYVFFKEHGGNDPLQNPQFVASTIAIRIHNAYFRAAAWKYVRDHGKLLQDLALDDANVFAQLKANPALCSAYLELHGMLKYLEASGQKELGLLTSASKHYMKHVKDSPQGLVWDPEAGLKLHKSLVDTIIIEMVFPQARYELSILMLCLRDAIALGSYKKTDRFDQEVFDAIGDLSVTLQLLDMLDTPISGTEAKTWRTEQSKNLTDAFSGTYKASESAARHVTGIASLVVPLTKTKTPATLEKVWETINQTYVARAGMDMDILWGLEDSMNPEPQWSAWALTATRSGDEEVDKNRHAIVRKNRPRPDLVPERKKRLAIANQPAAGDDEPPPLISDSEQEYSAEDWETDEDEDEWSEASDVGEDEQNYWDQILRSYEAQERAKEAAKEKEKEKSPEAEGNPFKTLFRSLKGRFLTKDPVLSVEPQPVAPNFESEDEAAAAAGGDDDLPGLLPTYPYENAPPDLPALIPLTVADERLKAEQANPPTSKVEVQKPNVTVEEVVDEEAHKPEGSGKKKKKKKKKTKKAGEPGKADEEEGQGEGEEPPRKTSKSPKALGGAAASMSSLYVAQPESAQSAQSYIKSEGIAPKSKTKSRPLEQLGTFMSRTFGWRHQEELEENEQVQEKRSGVAERLVSYMKGVKAKAIPVWKKILDMDKSKGQGGLGWMEFVKAMIDLGFEYDESSAGSRVRFDPPDKNDKSYTVHKPHPDPWLNPKRVKAIARDLKKMYGFDEASNCLAARDDHLTISGFKGPAVP